MRDDRQKRDDERRKWLQVAGHFGMGAVFGAVFALIVLFQNFFGLASVINTSESPMLVRIIFVFGMAGSFAFMAAITGFLFLVHED